MIRLVHPDKVCFLLVIILMLSLDMDQSAVYSEKVCAADGALVSVACEIVHVDDLRLREILVGTAVLVTVVA